MSSQPVLALVFGVAVVFRYAVFLLNVVQLCMCRGSYSVAGAVTSMAVLLVEADTFTQMQACSATHGAS